MGAIIKAYERKNVFYIEILGGDEEIPDLDFKKHYRLDCPVIPDNLDVYRHLIRVSGITNVAVFGGDGVCVFNKSQVAEDPTGFEKAVDEALAKLAGPNLKEAAFVEGGTVYAPQVKEEGRIVHERTPDLAAGPSGELQLAYVTDESGTNDVMLRTWKGSSWGTAVPIAATKADEYAPSIVSIAKGQVLVAYVSNENGRYDVHTVIAKDGKPVRREQVTRSADDAMAPTLARGPKGDVWLAWYEWAKMGEPSRDREVFVSRLASSGRSEPLRVSPRDVPTYEDHADPAVAPDGKGGAWVAWAWDYHGTLRTKKPPVEENSIFVRHVSPSLELEEILAAGYRGEGRARDYTPSIALGRDGTPWVAWDNSHKASLGYGAKAVMVNRLSGEDFAEQTEVAATSGPIDSPALLVDPKGGLHVLWGQGAQGGWEIWLREIGPAKAGGPRRLRVEGKSPRHPRGCFDSKGRLWVAYTDATAPRWQVRAELARAE